MTFGLAALREMSGIKTEQKLEGSLVAEFLEDADVASDQFSVLDHLVGLAEDRGDKTLEDIEDEALRYALRLGEDRDVARRISMLGRRVASVDGNVVASLREHARLALRQRQFSNELVVEALKGHSKLGYSTPDMVFSEEACRKDGGAAFFAPPEFVVEHKETWWKAVLEVRRDGEGLFEDNKPKYESIVAKFSLMHEEETGWRLGLGKMVELAKEMELTAAKALSSHS